MIVALSSEHILNHYIFETPSLAWVLSHPSKICQIILYLHFTMIRRPSLENGQYGLMFCYPLLFSDPSYTFPYGFSQLQHTGFLDCCVNRSDVFLF